MTEKKFFAYKLFLSLNISDFNLFLCENCNAPSPPATHLFPSNPPLKVEVLSSPPYWKFGWRLNPLQKGGGCPLWYSPPLITAPTTHFSNFLFSICEYLPIVSLFLIAILEPLIFMIFRTFIWLRSYKKTHVHTLVKINGCTYFHLSFLIRGGRGRAST